MSDINQKEINQLFNDSIQLIRLFVNRKIESPLTEYDQQRVKAASTFIGNYPRIRSSQALVAQVSLELMKVAAKDPEQLKQWVQSQIPHTDIIKGLPGVLDNNQKAANAANDKLLEQSGKFAAEREQWKKERDELQFKIMQLEEKMG